MHTVREKRRGGARPAALAVAVIAAMLVPAGAAAADDSSPTAESGVVAEQPATTDPSAAPEPVAAEPTAPVEPVASEPVTAEPVTAEPAAVAPAEAAPAETETPAPASAPVTTSTSTAPTTADLVMDEPGTMEGTFSFTGVSYDAVEEWTTAKVGTQVDAVPSSGWPAGAEYDIDWYTNGGTHVGDGLGYTPTVSDLGKDLSIAWTVTAPGYFDHEGGMSVANDIVAGSSPTPVQHGTVKVTGAQDHDVSLGSTLQLDLVGWPSDATEQISWTVNGLPRSTGRTFTPAVSDLGGWAQVSISITAPGMEPFQDYFWLGTVVTTPTVTVPSSSITVGDVASIPVTVAGPQGGPVASGVASVTLTPQGGGTPLVLPSTPLVGGVATFSAEGLPVGTYTVDAAYTAKEIQYSYVTLMMAEHSPAYRSATGSGVLTVNPATAQLTAPGSVRVAVATRAAFEATLVTHGATPSGTWTIREGGSVLAQGEVRKGGRIAVTLPVLSVGTHTLVLDVPSTPWASAASATVTVVVTGEPAQVGTTPTVGTVLETPKAATAPGQQMELVAEGFEPGETVAFYLHSEPMFLGTAVAGADGVARLMATVPAGAPVGAHTVIATGGTSGRWATLAVELAVPAAVTPVANPVVAAPAATPAAASPALAVTGSQSGTLMAGAWLMLLVGGGLVLVARRVRATR